MYFYNQSVTTTNILQSNDQNFWNTLKNKEIFLLLKYYTVR